MKRVFIGTASALLLLLGSQIGIAQAEAEATDNAATATQAESESAHDNTIDLDNEQAKRGYALGMDIGNSISSLNADLDVDALVQGVRDTLTSADTQLSTQEMEAVIQDLLADVKAAQQEQTQQAARENMKKSEAFLAENKEKEGVKVTDSGLQYIVLQEGEGPQPDASDKVTVHYTGKLIDGTVFDSTRERGEPVEIVVNETIPGWIEALQMMHEGAKYRLFIPSDLAYGERGAGAAIGPNQALIFDVELIEVNQQ